MTASRSPRGRLPARVYWVRRSVVLGTAMALVFGIAQVLGGSDAGGDDVATNAAADTPTTAAPTPGVVGPQPVKTGAAAPNSGKAVLPKPDGPCSVDQVTVTPTIDRVTAGRPVALTLQLTGIRPACTFDVSRRSLVAKVVVGPQRIWSTQDCPSAISDQTVTVYSGTPTEVRVIWSGRTSNGECSARAAWALPGSYRVIAAAIGSEPSEDKFTMIAPKRPVVIKTVQPQKAKAKATVNAGP